MLYQLNNNINTMVITKILFLGELSNCFNYVGGMSYDKIR